MIDLYYYRLYIASVLIIYTLINNIALEILRQNSLDNVQRNFGNTTIMVVAHPDDETMFFGPTIMNLIRANKSIVLLCLSNGNVDNEGGKRQEELVLVVKALGPNLGLRLLDDPILKDDINSEWNITHVADTIEYTIKEHNKPIDSLLTFDSYGISGHANHRSINRAVEEILKPRLQELGVNVVFLKSLPLWRKYTFFSDSIIILFSNMFLETKNDRILTMALNFSEYFKLKEILEIHHSQMVWFRHLYKLFSRYMFMNDLEFVT